MKTFSVHLVELLFTSLRLPLSHVIFGSLDLQLTDECFKHLVY